MKKRILSLMLGGVLALSMAFSSFAEGEAVNVNKKGLLMQPGMIQDFEELGCKYAEVCLSTAQDPGGYSWIARECHNKGINFTMILLNNFGGMADPNLLPVSQPVPGVGNYAFNTLTPEGEAAVRNYAKKLASIYGKNVDNWIISNEVNDGDVWDYTGLTSLEDRAQCYAKGFRIFYEEFKAVNPDAEVLFSLDMLWNTPFLGATAHHNSRPFLDRLNELLKDTDYGIAWHPYPESYYEKPEFMDNPNATDSVDSILVNMKNLHILTDYIQRPEMLAPDGSVRYLILSEMGFTSSCENGEERQAEAIRQAYQVAKDNPFVHAFILERQVDAQSQVDAGGAFGLWTRDTSQPVDEQPLARKKAWYVYKDLN